MEDKKQYFGFDEEVIRGVFRDSSDQFDKNCKIGASSTLSQLVEASGKLMEENKDFLHTIYNDLDE